jgi:hypothetical protein
MHAAYQSHKPPQPPPTGRTEPLRNLNPTQRSDQLAAIPAVPESLATRLRRRLKKCPRKLKIQR